MKLDTIFDFVYWVWREVSYEKGDALLRASTPNWGWSEFGNWSESNLSAADVDKLAEQVLNSRNHEHYFMFYRYVEKHPAILDGIVNSSNPELLHRTYTYAGREPRVLDALIKTGDGYWLFINQRDCGHDDRVLQTLAESGDGYSIYWHLRTLGQNEVLKNALKNLPDSRWWESYLARYKGGV